MTMYDHKDLEVHVNVVLSRITAPRVRRLC